MVPELSGIAQSASAMAAALFKIAEFASAIYWIAEETALF